MSHYSRIAYLLTMLALCLCYLLGIAGCSQNPKIVKTIYYNEKRISPYDLAIRFAPRLYQNPIEPYQIKDVLVIIHPAKPLISYHFIWEDDNLTPGFGFDSDHEVAWVEYDPISLNITDFWTLWHRGILHSDQSVIDAKIHGQHPSIFVQWGKHGLLPSGWEQISTSRLDVELNTHYIMAKANPYNINGHRKDETSRFLGSYSEYIAFDKMVDIKQYIKSDKVIIAIDSNKAIKKMLSYRIMSKQTWPY
jgi:hypothetical protein